MVDVTTVQQLAEAALESLAVLGPAELNLTLVDIAAITDLNVQYMDAAGPTDVLSFPLEETNEQLTGGDDVPRLLGDVVICPEVAAANAPAHAGTFEDEMALLCIHGILHILGHDHATTDEALAMHTLEAQLLTDLHRPLRVGTEIPQ